MGACYTGSLVFCKILPLKLAHEFTVVATLFLTLGIAYNLLFISHTKRKLTKGLENI